MKICFKCNVEKPLTDYYKHKKMGDGHLNKCKECTKKDTAERTLINISTPEGLEKERERHRDKYKRLGYKDKQNEWDKNRPWKSTVTYKNLSRKFRTPQGIELHHWNYNDESLEDVVLMDVKSHRAFHQFVELDNERRIFKVKETGEYLFSKLDHCAFIIECGFMYINPLLNVPDWITRETVKKDIDKLLKNNL